MTGVEHVEVRRGAYADSVTLMQVSRRVTSGPGVRAALIAMATDLNLELLDGMAFAPPPAASANDLLIAVRADDEMALRAALAAAEQALAPTHVHTAGERTEQPPHTTASALRRGGDLVLVSVPGRYAFAEAVDALDAGRDVMIFSDNVPVEQEVELKRRAAASGRLVLGPDCGTALVGGVGLGFANVVRPGSVGIVAASGTGAQQLMCLLDHAGVGVRACLGVGGRDVSSAVGGSATLAAMDVLDADPGTELIVIVTKPPSADVAEKVRAHASGLDTPVVLGLLGAGEPDLTALAERVVRQLGAGVPDWPYWPADPARPARGGALRALYSGGTLCDEARIVAGAAPGDVFLDFGDDALTQGRAHPMIDQSLRLERLAAEAADPTCGAVLMDVVLGHAAHPDPAAELAPVIAAAPAPVVVALVGTPDDPQRLHAQAEQLRSSGAAVFTSNAMAARHAVALVRGGAA